jgi:tetratricopeptide (TPR) repeat protein
MSVTDRYGLPLTASALAAERHSEGIERLQSQNAGVEQVLRSAVEADPHFALGWADLAFWQAYQRQMNAARETIKTAQAALNGCTSRERQHVDLIASFLTRPLGETWELVQAHLADHPRDALIVQMGVMIHSGIGWLDRRERHLAYIESLAPEYGDDWWFLSARAFANHETMQLDQARHFAERSLDLYPRNANAAHSEAHVFFESGDHASGSGFLGPWLSEYERAAPFFCHVSWHHALFELLQGRQQRALELFERAISPTVSRQRTTLEDSASLLWRYQLYGCLEASSDATPPWTEVCNLAKEWTATPGAAFPDCHAALAYVGGGDQQALERHLQNLRGLAAKGNELTATVVLPLAEGLQAFGAGDYEETIRKLEPIQGPLVRIGGSHAQREVFEDTLVQAYMRAGRWDQAAALLRARLSQRASDRDVRWLEQATAGSQESGARSRRPE